MCNKLLQVSTEKMVAYCDVCELDHDLKGMDLEALQKIENFQK